MNRKTSIPRFYPGMYFILNSTITGQNYIEILKFGYSFKYIVINNDFRNSFTQFRLLRVY